MTWKLAFPLFLMLAAFSMENETKKETSLQLMQKLERKEKREDTKEEFNVPIVKRETSDLFVSFNVFPNKSCVKDLHNVETNEIIWEDLNDFIPYEVKRKLESSLQKKAQEMSNSLFDCISFWYSNWDFFKEIMPFVKALLFAMAKNVHVRKSTEFDETPLMLASIFDAEEAVSKLIERGAKMEASDEYGHTALHFAAYNGSDSCCKLLLRNVNAQSNDGSTPLMLAAMKGHAETVDILLKNGANAKLKDRRGYTALQLARMSCFKIITAHELNE